MEPRAAAAISLVGVALCLAPAAALPEQSLAALVLEPTATSTYTSETAAVDLGQADAASTQLVDAVNVPTIRKGRKMWFAHVHKAAGRQFWDSVSDAVTECPDLQYVNIPYVAAYGVPPEQALGHGSAKTADFHDVQNWWFDPAKGDCILWSSEDHIGQNLAAMYDGKDLGAWVNGTDDVVDEPALLTIYRDPVDRCRSHWDYAHKEWAHEHGSLKDYPFGETLEEHKRFVDSKCSNFFSDRFTVLDASLDTADAIADWYERKVAFWGVSEEYDASLCLFYHQMGSDKFAGCGCNSSSATGDAGNTSSITDEAPAWLQKDQNAGGKREYALKLSDSDIAAANDVDAELFKKLKAAFEKRVQAVQQRTGCSLGLGRPLIGAELDKKLDRILEERDNSEDKE